MTRPNARRVLANGCRLCVDVNRLTLGNSDVLKQQDDRSHRDSRGKCRDEARVDIGGADVLESSGNCLENLDRVCALRTPTMTRIQPRCEGKDKNHKGTAECRDEEKHPGCERTMSYSRDDA